jgi:DNA-binding transcriptional regulator GbsR (MarR family)
MAWQFNLKLRDPATGQIMFAGVSAVPQKAYIKQSWFMMFQDMLNQVAEDRELWGLNFAVLCKILARMDFENWVLICHTDIAEELKTSQPKVSAAIALLLKKRLLEQGPKSGRINSYRVCIDLAWKGKARNLNREAEQQIRQILERTYEESTQ